MQWTGLNEVREKYLSFFASKGHLRLKSFPLVPQNDNSLLLINSGMAPMKKYFTGEITPPNSRVTTCQKCIRTPDIERVGITARHGTYFEMLGNFSFGDYFKSEATAWAWEFCTKTLELPVDRLWVSIYQEDDQAFDIWVNEVGVSAERIVRLGKEDNFWEHGAGPCGPCSEIYFDRGEQYGCGNEGCGVGCDCDRYVEFWNLVFTQFESDGKGNYTPLAKPNIDTGMGLERLACILQQVDNLFLVDTVRNIMNHISQISGVKYGADQKTDISLRVITDHIRSTTFMIGDGVKASNEGRGYVLRRLLRRAARHGRLLGITRPFLTEVCETVIGENKDAYPELEEKKSLILKLIEVEEEAFSKTIDQGLGILAGMIENSHSTGVLSGDDAFKINDTYGFPLDLTKEILAEKGMKVDEERFRELMNEQRQRARNARKNAGADAWIGDTMDFSAIPETVFTGYDRYEEDAEVVGLIVGGTFVNTASEGDEVTVLLDKSPFYTESGGQVGDTGKIFGTGVTMSVKNTTNHTSGISLHHAELIEGEVNVGDVVTAEIDTGRRLDIMRNHTAAHLLQSALRKVLGDHVEQAGQLVNEKVCRFDFSHFSAMTKDELEKVEKLVNDEILAAVPVTITEMSLDEARKIGAMALFGEKYGETVRVVNVPEFSTELCGGTHSDNTAKLCLFKIISESSVAAGVRRIEAVTGRWVKELLDSKIETIIDAATALKLSNPADLVSRAVAVMQEIKVKEKQLEELNSALADVEVQSLLSQAVEVSGVKTITVMLENKTAENLKTIGTKIIERSADTVVVLASTMDGKASICAAVGAEARKKGLHAGKLVKEVAILAGGNGGGRPDIATAGAKDPSKLAEAISQAGEIIGKFM